MFAYIDNHGELTNSMVQQYNDSLIFLGDEKQIFVPLINAYVGIGTTAYNNLLERIGQSNDNLNEYNKYIHCDTVTSIYTQFSPTELETFRQASVNGQVNVRGISISEQPQTEVVFKANKNIVLKGLNDYNLPNGEDELGRTVSTYNTSGITLNIEHNGSIHIGRYEFNGVQYSYTYYDPYDTITIDDTKTWSYITASNSYMTHFVTKFATEQANRVYKNLLGESDVFIEKEFDEAFNYDHNDDYNTNWLYEFEDVFVKRDDGSYQKIEVENDENGAGFAILLNGQVIYTNIPVVNDEITINGVVKSVLTSTQLQSILAGKGNAGLYGGYIKLVNGKIIPVWYHRDNSTTASSYINIVDGIQTIKEVAYILDTLTDGSEDGAINLAYNISYNYVEIQELKKWKQQLGSETVSSFKSESSNELLTVNYYSTNLWDKDRDADGASIGKVKLDLDLRLAQTYVLDDVTYAAYYANHPGANVTYFAYTGDPTDVRNYLMLDNTPNSGTGGQGTKTEEVVWLLQHQDPKYENTSTVVKYYSFEYNDPNNVSKVTGINYEGSFAMGSITNSTLNGKYIYFPYKQSRYDFTKGLTDVKWVTTYVGWACEDLANRLSGVNDAVMTYITDKIEALDYQDYDNTYLGMFVSEVSEEDGVISVTKKKLPLDTILKHDIFYTNDIYLHIETKYAQDGDHINNIYRYAKDNVTNTYQFIKLNSTQVNNLSADVDMYDDIYYKTTLASMQPVPGSTSANPATVGDMISNRGHVTYFYKEEEYGFTKYLPLDIHTAYTEGTLFVDDVVKDNNTIYYWAGTASQIKYFDVNTIHRTDGSTTTLFTSYITYLSSASAQNSGLADAWDVRRTIESMFQWVNIKTNKIIS